MLINKFLGLIWYTIFSSIETLRLINSQIPTLAKIIKNIVIT